MNQLLYDPNESWAATIARGEQRQEDRWWERPNDSKQWRFKRAAKLGWRLSVAADSAVIESLHSRWVPLDGRLRRQVRESLPIGVGPHWPWGHNKPACFTGRLGWQVEQGEEIGRYSVFLPEIDPESGWIVETPYWLPFYRWHRGLDPNRLPD